jgi:hypothetical protein
MITITKLAINDSRRRCRGTYLLDLIRVGAKDKGGLLDI